MSYWATVITNLFSAIPQRPEDCNLAVGRFTVGDPTCTASTRCISPAFIIVAVVGLHLIALHRFGSNNPLGIDAKGRRTRSRSIPITRSKTCSD
jgi:ubiquinol-cytochrome c reductase cytochrome b subunit